MALPPKVCPSCGEEYVHSATMCVHCDVGLVLEGELPAGGPAADGLPPTDELHCVRVSVLAWAFSLSDRLRGADIPHRVEAVSDDGEESDKVGAVPYGVYVRPEHATAAGEIDADHTAHQIPDMPDEIEEGDEGACPACGTQVDGAASECPDCGLALLAPA